VVDYAKPIAEESGPVTVGMTTDVAHAVVGADMVLVSILAKGHTDLGERLAGVLQPMQPLVMFPGKFCSSYLLRRSLRAAGAEGEYDIGEVSTSIFYAHKDQSDITGPWQVHTRNMKSKVQYSNIDPARNADRVAMLNELFRQDSFIDGMHPLRIALQSHDSTLNAVAIIAAENSFRALRMQGEVPRFSLYGSLSGPEADLINDVYGEREHMAGEFGFQLEGIAEWLARLNPSIQDDMDLSERLVLAYGDKAVTLEDVYGNRRLVEDVPFGLVPLESLADHMSARHERITRLINYANNVKTRGLRVAHPDNGYAVRADFRMEGPKLDALGIEVKRVIELC